MKKGDVGLFTIYYRERGGVGPVASWNASFTGFSEFRMIPGVWSLQSARYRRDRAGGRVWRPRCRRHSTSGVRYLSDKWTASSAGDAVCRGTCARAPSASSPSRALMEFGLNRSSVSLSAMRQDHPFHHVTAHVERRADRKLDQQRVICQWKLWKWRLVYAPRKTHRSAVDYNRLRRRKIYLFFRQYKRGVVFFVLGLLTLFVCRF